MKVEAKLRFKNYAMVRWRQDNGLNQTQAAEFAGIPISAWRDLECLRYPASFPEDRICEIAVKTGINPDDIMTPELVRYKTETVTRCLSVQPVQLLEWQRNEQQRNILPSPAVEIENKDMTEHLLEACIPPLTYREREIVKLRYGIGEDRAYSLAELGRIFKVTRERITQVEANAIRKIQRWTQTHSYQQGA